MRQQKARGRNTDPQLDPRESPREKPTGTSRIPAQCALRRTNKNTSGFDVCVYSQCRYIYVNIKLKPETSGKFNYTIFTPDLIIPLTLKIIHGISN
jgi:hypothetical protein